MPFFHDLPDPEPQEPMRNWEPEWRRVPRERIPVTMPFGHVVHRSDQAAVVITSLDVYPTGFCFTVQVLRHPEAPSQIGGLHSVLHGSGPYGPMASDDIVRIGLRLADGRRAELHSRGPFESRPGPPEAALTSRGGGGSGDYASSEIFAWPIPEEGDVDLMFQWRSEGLEELAFTLSGDELRAAAAASTEIWPGAKLPEPPEPGEFGGGWRAYC